MVVVIRDLPECLIEGYNLPIDKFHALQQLTLDNAITKTHLRTLESYLRQNGSDHLVYLDLSNNDLRGGIGRIF